MPAANPFEQPRHDYERAGFDAFLTRSIDGPLANLTSTPAGPPPRQIDFDRQQVNGVLGDTFKVGESVRVNGSDGNIILNDGENDRLLLGSKPSGA